MNLEVIVRVIQQVVFQKVYLEALMDSEVVRQFVLIQHRECMKQFPMTFLDLQLSYRNELFSNDRDSPMLVLIVDRRLDPVTPL